MLKISPLPRLPWALVSIAAMAGVWWLPTLSLAHEEYPS